MKANEEPLWLMLISAPVRYLYAILKIFAMIPMVIIAGCDYVLSKINYK